jgi:23S rRNA pseudouridine1911/1915/1917 synthase
MPELTPKLLHVSESQSEKTLAAILRAWQRDQSWSHVRKLIAGRRVTINGNLCVDGARRLKAKDVIKVLLQPAAAPPKEHDVRIVYIDEHVVVVEKPSGVTTNRHAEERNWPQRRRQLQPTLDEMLPRIVARKERSQHPGKRTTAVRPVHRLDRETSGLIVFARTQAAERNLMLQFRNHTTARKYLAIAEGRVHAQTIDTQLVRDRGDGRRGSSDEADVGKRAITHVTPREHAPNYTLLECRLETGRTHQIRIHLAELGHPLCGEKVYRPSRRGKPSLDSSGAPRVALHAAEIEFDHPATGRRMHFDSQLPPDLRDLWNRLRRSAKPQADSERL